MEEIYKLKLHESVALNSFMDVIRVPGGWIYDYHVNDVYSTVFVPFNNDV